MRWGDGQGMDGGRVAKNASTASTGNIASIAESPKREGLLYIGTDDGLIRCRMNAGASWRKAGFPCRARRNQYRGAEDLVASLQDERWVNAALEQSQNGDFSRIF